MIRLIAVAIGLVLLALIVIRLVREAGTLKLDWTGLTFACGFVAMAFYLRHVTGMG